jgi:hypothetical protein
VIPAKRFSFLDDLPAHDPLIAWEAAPYGWRGLTANGEVLEVRSRNGVPSGDIVMARGGSVVSRLAHPGNVGGPASVDKYLMRYDAARAHARANRPLEALREWDAALAIAPTVLARFNRALTLLALGRWTEGFGEFQDCELVPVLMRQPVREAIDAGIEQWRGEPIAGKRLLLIHAHGFGDSLMMLRYVDELRRRGAEVMLLMPPALTSLASQIAPVETRIVPADYFCPILHLLGLLGVTPDNVGGLPAPYLKAPRANHVRVLNGKDRRRIGIAWSTGNSDAANGDYEREIPLSVLLTHLRDRFGDEEVPEFHSVQIQDARAASRLGVVTYDFEDFGHCAEVMMTMDQIVSVDTAALHLAGAIGHPDVTGLLRDWHSWRWLAPWYENVELRRWTDAH